MDNKRRWDALFVEIIKQIAKTFDYVAIYNLYFIIYNTK